MAMKQDEIVYISDEEQIEEQDTGVQIFNSKFTKPLKVVRTCPHCEKLCSTKLEVYQHAVNCSPVFYKCSVKACPFASTHKQHFDYHMKTHKEIKDIQCNLCTYKCATKTMLKSHMRKHDKKPKHANNNSSLNHQAVTNQQFVPGLKEDGIKIEENSDGDFKGDIRAEKRRAETDSSSEFDSPQFKKLRQDTDGSREVSESSFTSDTTIINYSSNEPHIDFKPINIVPMNNNGPMDVVPINICETIDNNIEINTVLEEMQVNQDTESITDNNDQTEEESMNNQCTILDEPEVTEVIISWDQPPTHQMFKTEVFHQVGSYHTEALFKSFSYIWLEDSSPPSTTEWIKLEPLD